MLVMKFGGSSLADADAVHRVCSIIERRAEDGVLVVVSAFGDTTDRLLDAASATPPERAAILENLRARTESIARAVLVPDALAEILGLLESVLGEAADLACKVNGGGPKPVPSADLDALLACGERISSRVVVEAFRARGLDACHLDSRDLFVTEPGHGGVPALYKPTRERIRQAALPLLGEGKLVVLGGFMASDQAGAPTTLGRGGSDYTASLAGAALEAGEVQIWTDVDGVMTADPSLIPAARSLQTLTLGEASELAYFGARVLHPSTMLPAIEHGVPIRVLNSLRPEAEGTLVRERPAASENVIKAVAYKEGITLIDIRSTRMLMAHGFLAKIFTVFERHETAVDMVSTSEVSVSLTVDNTGKLPEILADLEGIALIETAPGKAIVCVVGDGIRYTPGIAAAVFDALDGIRIRMISLGASRLNVAFVVDEQDLEDTVRRLHSKFFPEPPPPTDPAT